MRGGPGHEHCLRPCSRPDCCTATSGCQRPKPPAVPCNMPTSSPPGQLSRVWNQRQGRVQERAARTCTVSLKSRVSGILHTSCCLRRLYACQSSRASSMFHRGSTACCRSSRPFVPLRGQKDALRHSPCPSVNPKGVAVRLRPPWTKTLSGAVQIRRYCEKPPAGFSVTCQRQPQTPPTLDCA